MDTLPTGWGSEPTDLEQPYVTLDVPDEGRMFTLTPAAYQTAAALISAADAANAAHHAATNTT